MAGLRRIDARHRTPGTCAQAGLLLCLAAVLCPAGLPRAESDLKEEASLLDSLRPLQSSGPLEAREARPRLLAAAPAPQPAAQKPRINPTGRTINLQVPLKDAGGVIGTVVLRIDTDDSLSLEAAGLLALLGDTLAPETLQRLSATAQEGRLTPAHFAAAGLELRFDPGLLELLLVVPSDARQEQVLSLARRRDGRSQLDQPAVLSGFANINAGANHVSDAERDDGNGFNDLQIDIDGALRAWGPVLEFETTYADEELTGDPSFSRRGTRLLVDHPETALTFGAGDLFTSGRGLQDSVDLLGLGVTRDFDLQPSRNVRPRAGRRFTLTRPSTVDVRVDGLTIRRLRLGPGTFDLRDIPLTSGSNEIELIIEDDAGQVETILFDALFDADLLETGTYDYSLSAGFFAEPEGDSLEYQFDAPVASGFLRAGLTPSLTLGLNAQGGEDRQQAGVEALVPTGFGTFALDLAASYIRDRGSGFGAELGFDAHFGRDDPLNRSLTLSLEAFTRDYEGLDLRDIDEEDDDAPLSDTAIDFSIIYGQTVWDELRGSLGVEFNRERGNRDDSVTLSTSLAGNLPVTQGANWSLRLEWDSEADTRDLGFSGFLSLNIPLDRTSSVLSELDSEDRSSRTEYQYQGGNGRIGSFNADVAIETNEDEDFEAEGGLDYTDNRFRVDLDHDTRFTALEGGNRETVTRGRLRSALAFAGDQVAIGREVGDSFAIVHGHPSLEGRRIRVDPSQQGDVARSDFLGPALVPNLGTYTPRTVTLEIDDLPPGYDLGAGVFTVAPPRAAGYALQVGSGATVTVLGTLIDARTGDPLGLVAGQAVHLQDQDFAPVTFFSNRVGRFAISGLKPGRYELRLNTTPPRVYALEVPEDTVALYRIDRVPVP